ncbi:acyltransferase family protein [Mycolicibacterium austroafricanum]|uniref:acyltransferase family protein n=1 Tax=Mycolicibacterium austroafricanum TaxID=39687 RepID=UPI001ABFF2BB|nr:acyltransferase family protein [Mycolicibacterium austroafricanum]QRZ05877.1 acyltransferase [Mycolicibacterium austroafricanum]
MTTLWNRYDNYSHRRRRRAARSSQRLDIQGLRMVAVLTVFANHLWGWPSGGFVGVDVFFVISGFLITGNLLRDAETRGTVSFRKFYWNRVRRIVPAATVVLILTCVAALLVFQPFRAREVAVDAGWAFVFLSNWWFAAEGTDYFTADNTVSPLQHYWSLSIEEQFYFVWPAIIFLISLVVVRKAWGHDRRTVLAGTVMGVIVALSLAWALFETATSPTWAYFNTFARVWELGVGALLACLIGALARIPEAARPILSWAGLALIAASLLLISDDAVGFPAPWALLPVAGAALVIAAGSEGEPKYQAFLRNPLSGYVGDISYSLYLVHWPIIVIAGSLMDNGPHFSIMVIALAFGLAVASYHFVEQPLRKADLSKFRAAARDIRKRRYQPQQSSRLAAVSALALIVAASTAYVLRPEAYELPAAPPPLAVAAPQESDPSGVGPQAGPLTAALQAEIVAALKATEWPHLDPSIEEAIRAPESPPDVHACDDIDPLEGRCVWGPDSAPTRIVVVGDSVALAYVGPLREIALNSGGHIQVRSAAMGGCAFADFLMAVPDQSVLDTCPTRTRNAIELINTTKPDVVVISNLYNGEKRPVGSEKPLNTREWSSMVKQMIDKFRPNTDKVVLLSPPPADKDISECYGQRGSVPADCISEVTELWRKMALADQGVAGQVGGIWIDSRPWFCSANRYCPAFVGLTPTKRDAGHMSMYYGLKIHPVIAEALHAAGVL